VAAPCVDEENLDLTAPGTSSSIVLARGAGVTLAWRGPVAPPRGDEG
jgi:hypothetical protein